MRAGHGSVPLPVPDGTPLGGYAARVAPSDGALAPLRVDCVSIAAGADRFLLVVAELAGVNTDLVAEIRRRTLSVPAPRVGTLPGGAGHAYPIAAPVGDAVWVCATHTHSGPDVGTQAGGGTTPATWLAAVAAAAAEAARLAVANETECVAAHHDGVLDGVGSRRGADDGDRRVPVDVLRFGPAGAPAGVLAVVPVHPTVLPASSSVVSGDLTAWIRDELRARLGGSPWVVVATGAAGDVSTRWTRTEQTAGEGRRLAALAADQLAALVATPGRAWSADDGIDAARATLPLPVRHDDRDRLAGLRAEFTGRLAGLADGDPSGRAAVTALQGVEAAAGRSGAATVPLELAAVRLGGLTLQGIGGEPFLSLRDVAAPSVLLGYANGYAGYLPAAADFATPGYEVLISPFRPDAAERAAGVLHELVHRTTHGG
ncbi:hypothetical protein [Jiangella alba]|uniref:Neutral/alkaline non-lysosomal ceramidase, N-terminal n=1 Tax=Jiangella alba TaxID=561176 RepID=A0A1H5PIF9_9ACTN|nr:hypothetical protein [Jiangella alba]SEF13424.1 hypothetical protein SAMN04488561_4388 [Jiangella alba]